MPRARGHKRNVETGRAEGTECGRAGTRVRAYVLGVTNRRKSLNLKERIEEWWGTLSLSRRMAPPWMKGERECVTVGVSVSRSFTDSPCSRNCSSRLHATLPSPLSSFFSTKTIMHHHF